MRKIILEEHIGKEILEKYKSGLNINAIVRETGIGRRHIKRVIKDANLTIQTKSELIRNSIPELNNKDLLLSLHYSNNLSLLDIAIKFHTNEQVIKTAFKILGIKNKSSVQSKNDKFNAKYSTLLDKDKLSKLYLIEKKSPETIAKILGCSDSAVIRALNKLKIKLRNHNEASTISKLTPEQRKNAKIARNLRTRFWIALDGKTKMASAVRDLGCNIEELKEKFKILFYDNPADGRPMTWDNYGEWEIDHIKPLSAFNLSNPEQQKEACHYDNLQPLWQKSNRQKSNKLPSKLPNRVSFYIVAGPAGSGKSWVCDQLEDVNYISYDLVPKEQHYHYMLELSKNGKPIIYDPFRKISTIYDRYKGLFDMKVVLIEESVDVVHERLISRGSKLSRDKVETACKKSSRYRKLAHFSGTSNEILSYLKEELLKNSPTP